MAPSRPSQRAGPAVSGPCGPVTPVFKLCFRSSERFAGVFDLGASAQPLAFDRCHSPVLLSLMLSAAHQKAVDQLW